MSRAEHVGHEIAYSSWDDGYDAHYCVTCNAWLEKGCSDPQCSYCAYRPATPLPIVANKRIIQEFENSRAYLAAVGRGEIIPSEDD